MKRAITAALAAALATSSLPVSAKQSAPEHLYGPPPTWAQYRQIAEADLRTRLIDPESARFSWLGGYYKGGFKSLMWGTAAGYFACGTVNARNRMGGYAGQVTFIVAVDYDLVVFAQVDKGASGFAHDRCSQLLRDGTLPPVPQETASTVSVAPSTPAAGAASPSGLSLRTMPDGAYVSGVTKGSAAERAGLKPGMVIASVNAIPLSGMGDAMLKVVDAAGSTAALTIIGGKTMTLGARP